MMSACGSVATTPITDWHLLQRTSTFIGKKNELVPKSRLSLVPESRLKSRQETNPSSGHSLFLMQSPKYNYAFTLNTEYIRGVAELTPEIVQEIYAPLRALYEDHTAKTIRVAIECAPTTGRYHGQGYIQLVKKVRASTMVNWPAFRPSLHITGTWFALETRGSPQENEDYCFAQGQHQGKEGTTDFERLSLGDLVNPGDRSDLAAGMKVIDNGGSLREAVAAGGPGALRAVRQLEKYAQLVAPPVPDYREMVVNLHYGPSGTGKSRNIRALARAAGRSYIASTLGSGTFWFDGLDHNTNELILDDYVGEYALTQLLRLLDVYPCKLPIKGGFVDSHYTVVSISTNIHPIAWYSWLGRTSQYAALRRRFTGLYLYPLGGSVDGTDALYVGSGAGVPLSQIFWENVLYPTPLRSLFVYKREQLQEQLDGLGDRAYDFYIPSYDDE